MLYSFVSKLGFPVQSIVVIQKFVKCPDQNMQLFETLIPEVWAKIFWKVKYSGSKISRLVDQKQYSFFARLWISNEVSIVGCLLLRSMPIKTRFMIAYTFDKASTDKACSQNNSLEPCKDEPWTAWKYLNSLFWYSSKRFIP